MLVEGGREAGEREGGRRVEGVTFISAHLRAPKVRMPSFDVVTVEAESPSCWGSSLGVWWRDRSSSWQERKQETGEDGA
eukprot:3705550-Rhodomonas_salina.1